MIRRERFLTPFRYHLHYMVLALGLFLVNYSALLSVPVCINYAVEIITRNAIEVSVAMTIYRLALGLAIPFFFEAWADAVGDGWLFGMAAFFSVLMALVLGLLMWKGRSLRHLPWAKHIIKSEEGERVVQKSQFVED